MSSEVHPRHTNRRGLPLQLTTFVGRAREVEEVRALLNRTRTLTLTGSGGVGKTRLAVEAAGTLGGDFAGGVWFVDLAPHTDPSLVASAVASASDISEYPGQPVETTLAQAVGDQRILLVLDNCEHLVDACATLADMLLRACGGLRILATSRQILGVSGEVTLAVPVLTLPPTDVVHASSAADSEAVQLFVERAAAARPAFALTDANTAAVVRICRHLDGVPLAIELAAARIRVLSPEQIAERLDDRFSLLTGGNRMGLPRHRTLEATVSWSYELLGDAERALFRRLAVFSGGWTLEAAEAVCGDSANGQFQLAPRQALEGLSRLVDRSLVVADEASGGVRYRFLETIRQFAQERLLELGGEQPDVRRAHAMYFVAVAECAEPHLYGADAPSWMAHLTAEHDNMRAALRWALDAKETELALRLGASLYRFWRQRGHIREGRAWLEQALNAAAAVPDAQPDRLVSARALNGAGVLARRAGDFEAALPLLAKSLTLFATLEDDEAVANVEQNLGHVLFRLGDKEGARAHLESSLERLRRLDSLAQSRSASLFGCLNVLGKLALQAGNLAAARTYIFEAETCARVVGGATFIAHALILVGVLHLVSGDRRTALSKLREALTVATSDNDTWITLQALHGLASAAAQAGSARHAAVLTAAVEALGSRTAPGDVSPELVLSVMAQRLHDAIAGLDSRVRAAAEAEGAAMTIDEAVTYAVSSTDLTAVDDGSQIAAPLLSPREQQVARLIIRGYTSRQIAEELVIAEPTAERHVANIFVKLGVHSRAQVAAWTVEHLSAGV